MNCEKWYTLEDVTRDLAKATGQCINGINERFVVTGDQKPKYNDDKDFEEIQKNCEKFNSNCNENKPDLQGITEMLRMVNEYSAAEPLLAESENLYKLKETFNKEIIVLSKLNPNVKEFVPKIKNLNINKDHQKNKISVLNNAQNQSKQEKAHGCTAEQNSNIDKQYNHICGNNVNKISHSKINVSNLDPIEKVKLEEQLRSTISSMSKTDCMKTKMQRNLAIATLLKLVSSPTKQITQNSHIKSEAQTELDSKAIGKENQRENEINTDSNMDKENERLERPTSSKSIQADTNNTFEDSIEQTSQEDTNDVSPTEIKKSIEKVNKWLKSPERNNIKSPSLFLGQITFRSKNNRYSPMSQGSSISETSVTETIENYVPSAYASELSEKYMKRLKEKHVTKNIWTDLEEQLKLKDEIIRNKSLSSLES